jgi:hypothetical protein
MSLVFLERKASGRKFYLGGSQYEHLDDGDLHFDKEAAGSCHIPNKISLNLPHTREATLAQIFSLMLLTRFSVALPTICVISMLLTTRVHCSPSDFMTNGFIRKLSLR